jgi:hypothetical protein
MSEDVHSQKPHISTGLIPDKHVSVAAGILLKNKNKRIIICINSSLSSLK